MIVQEDNYLVKIEENNNEYRIDILDVNTANILGRVILINDSHHMNIIYSDISKIKIIHNIICNVIDGKY